MKIKQKQEMATVIPLKLTKSSLYDLHKESAFFSENPLFMNCIKSPHFLVKLEIKRNKKDFYGFLNFKVFFCFLLFKFFFTF